MPTPIIELKDVELWYDKGKPSEVHALKNVSLTINKGEYVAFFGPSGCGKTTLLYLLAGIDSPASGQILINGRDIGKFTRRELAVYRQMAVGIVFQQFNLITSIKVWENVALPMAFFGISLDRRREEAMKLLSRLGMEQYAERFPHELSGGQQQRVGIARALANNAPIILADEPLGNLDSDNAQKALEFFKELNQKDNRTIVMVTHEAWSLRDCQRIFYMKDGEILKVEKASASTSIAKSLSTYFYKELHPHLAPIDLMAATMSQLLLRGYSADEVKRFEFFLSQRFKGAIDEETFAQVLDRPFSGGGVGLWRQKAKKIAHWVEEVVNQRKNIEELYNELEKNPETPIQEEIARIRAWITEGYKGKILEIQKIRLDEITSERLRNIITPSNFRQVLRLSIGKFGVGFSLRTADRIAEKLEAVLFPEEDGQKAEAAQP
ncbi:ABC transporter ATP-binding protein [Candidatus Wolfebacteria bacterium]|nr:ABC transporter ATP-binding protein [Candidatus Wolfebacteria bacterium]